MDISAALTRAEVATLTYPERSCANAVRELRRLTGSAEGKEKHGAGAFEESLRVKNTLDNFEQSTQQQQQPSTWNVLAVLVNCEWMLWGLNKETPLRKNPFLSHWVEVVQRLGSNDISSSEKRAKKPADAGDAITLEDIWNVRVELIKRLLSGKRTAGLGDKSPRDLYAEFVERRESIGFELRTYVRILEEEGIYEKTPEPDLEPEPSSNSQDSSSKSKGPSRLDHFQQWKQDILQRLKDEPDVALPEITHLPIELSYLDFLTTLLTDRTLEALSIDPAPIITSYIQHALRLVERMGQPPGSNDSPSNGDPPWDIDHGREAQSRAVRLLLLFIRNLMRKELVGMETLYFEIQEICVRYVWIREVREFRAWVEEGVVDEAKAG